MMTRVKSRRELEAMRVSGQMLATVLELLRHQTIAGLSTKDVATIAATELKRLGGKPAFLGYQGFPDIICISVNDEVVHGIPSPDKHLKDGDLVGLDFGVNYQGMITDSAISLIVGKTGDTKLKALVRDTEQALLAGIGVVKDGVAVGDIGAAVQAVLDKGRYGIVRDLVGHGVGHDMHEEPNIPNYGRAGHGQRLKTGMTIAIEPMATLGTDRVFIDPDGWTIRTRDGSLSAHFEHTVLITEDGSEILTSL
ncbi:MAG: type I methionyl aminopeptidase [Candidatus Saccharimonadales bacterium]